MAYLKNTLSISVILLLILAASSSSVLAFSFGDGPPDGLTGAPNEGNCTQCHAGNTLNAVGGALMLTVPENYSPGVEYDIIVNLSRTGQSRWGFEMTALNRNGARAGTFATANANTQLSEENSKQYIKHTSTGTARGERNANSWTFKWTAPSTNIGPITFYAAGNAANGDFGTSGDYIYTQKATSDVPLVYGVTLAGVGTLTRSTTDASAGVRYTLRVTNTGNTNDTIRLTTSGDATATVSPASVSLNRGSSRTVTLRVSGAALAQAGDYEVKVTAISQGDDTKTAEVSTTTTILPVYDVSLAGVGSLTTKTADASEGVTYTLKVTNTGNTDDIIDLATSDNATLSQTSISLASGASAEVILTIAGDVLANAGDYEVTVTATSQGDDTKTAEITTKTTITPVYSVMLAGVGSLTTKTADASQGVTYTITITNTGNTSDTINLATSEEAATLSQTSVSLASRASTNVTLTIPSTALATAGEYGVTVTATSQGDNTKTAEITTKTTITPVYSVMLAGVGDLTTKTADASQGVTYTIKVTNTGNTDDIIDLATSDNATLSQSSVSLASGASAEVILTIAGDLLANAGNYEVKATATSQGDNTKTAEITTKTTITPVYSVMLAGVGSLTTETADASAGVSYLLNVTNTGNTDDIIDLATSENATLSQSSVSLASGASAEVTLTISADALAIAGKYDVIITATSQGDDTKTAEITTKTTIIPVYGVMLAGVDSLTTETPNASAGVTYTLTITNTGNTSDTINLATSEEDATLSQTSVSLASRASTNVTLTIPSTALATAGDYEVKATATSQGDNTKTAEITTKTTITPVYGVMLAGVDDLTTETADASQGVTYTLTITNTGNTDDVIDLAASDEVATLSQSSVSLASGASAEVTLTISANALVIAGKYDVIITATSQGDDTKTAQITAITTILPIYDVSVAGVGSLTTETTDASAGVSYALNVTNTGNTDDIIDLATSDNATLSQSSVSLASGASAEVTLTIAGDVLTNAGDYEVKVTAISQGDNTKTAEVATTTTILPVYGVMLNGVGALAKSTVDADDGINYTLRVINTGNTDDIIDLATSDDSATLSQTSISLASGASAEVILTVSSDVLATAGKYDATVTATSQGDNTKTAQITAITTNLPVYGVMLAGVGSLTTETTDASEGVTYTLTITNTGNTDDVIDLATSDNATLSQSSVSLASGASAEVTLTVSSDVLANAGDYEVKVTVISQGDNTKTAEVATTTTILPVYDVMLAGVGSLTTETADASEGVTYTLTITNTGNTDDTISLSSSAEVGIGGSVLGSFRLPDTEEPATGQLEIMLGAGASANVMFTASGDLLTKPGEYEIKVTATSQGDNTKTAEVSTKTTILPVYGITLIGEGDLKGATMDTLAGVDYTLTITNTGNTDDTIVLDSSAAFGIEGSVLGSFRQSDDQVPMGQLEIELAAGASVEITFTAAGDFFTKPGEYEIKVTATSQGDNTKTAEVSTKTTILPVYGVTLIGKDDLKGATMDTLAGIDYTLTITNTGNTDDTIVLGSSAEVGIEGSVLGSFRQSDDQVPMGQLEIMLAAGASAEVTFTAAGDFFTKPGEYEIKVTATSQGDTTKTAEITTVTTIKPVPWDINADGTVNIQDLVLVANQIGKSGEGLSGDVNMDGEVNILDLVQVTSYFGKTQAEIVQANQ